MAIERRREEDGADEHVWDRRACINVLRRARPADRAMHCRLLTIDDPTRAIRTNGPGVRLHCIGDWIAYTGGYPYVRTYVDGWIERPNCARVAACARGKWHLPHACAAQSTSITQIPPEPSYNIPTRTRTAHGHATLTRELHAVR